MSKNPMGIRDEQEFDREVGHRLRLWRKRAGLNQADLADQIGIPRATYGNYERGRTHITLHILWRLAVILKIRPGILIPDALPASHPIPFASGTAALADYWLGGATDQ